MGRMIAGATTPDGSYRLDVQNLRNRQHYADPASNPTKTNTSAKSAR